MNTNKFFEHNEYYFRVWDKINRRWVLPFEIIKLDSRGYLSSLRPHIHIMLGSPFVDINGKRIFDFDYIYAFNDTHEIKNGLVVYQKGCFKILYKDKFYFLSDYIEHIEVIGNIHDNPELKKIKD